MERLPEFVAPDYEGGSIANVPPTVAALLGVPFDGLPPLASTHWQPLAGNVRRVVVLLLDSLGWNLVEKEQALLAPLLAQAATVSRLTSVFPSTTVAALSSLWTGVTPLQHGLVGLHLFLRELGVIGQFISFSPAFAHQADRLLEGGLDPQTFLQWPGMAQQLAAGGVPTHALRGVDIVDSSLSRMHSRGVAAHHGSSSFAEMMDQVRGLLEKQPGERLFISAYWPQIDTLSHLSGWSSDAVAVELGALLAHLQTRLLDRLSPAAREGTVLLILADHGQVVVPPAQHHYLEDYPDLADMLLMPPTGEPRVAYLFARQGMQAELTAGLNEQLGEALTAWQTGEAVALGLFGPEPHNREGILRLGDVVAATRGDHALFASRAHDGRLARIMLGRHGSLSEAEMIVPLIGLRLG